MEIPVFRGNSPSNPGKLREQAPSENSSDLNPFGPLQAEIKNRTSVNQSIAPARPINSGIPHFLEAEPAMPLWTSGMQKESNLQSSNYLLDSIPNKWNRIYFQSSLGELEFLDYTEESGPTYDCDVGRELKNKEKVQETPSAKEIRQEQEVSMDEEQGVMDKLNLPDIDYGTPEPRKNSPLKKIQIKAPENISIKQEAPLAEESPVIIVSETLEEPLHDLSSTLNILEEIKEIPNVQENLHTYSTEFELNQSPILTAMENLEANVLSLDVTHLAISLETCIFQKDPGRSAEKKSIQHQHTIITHILIILQLTSQNSNTVYLQTLNLLILLKYSSSLTLFTLKKLKQKIILTKQTTSDLSSKESSQQE
ncbi:hypothetical protein H4Q26_004068 [Puccinia striiformis f. sp. tritici PST-130]|nr:hypothetical protein H4Q26_004068 [Puccinia striiformis f. sp. tritici PST-130]